MIKRCSETFSVQKKSDLTAAQLKDQNRWPVYRVLLYLNLIVAIFRFLASAYVLRTGKFTEYHAWDVLSNLAIQAKLINFNTSISFAAMPIFIIYYDYTVYVKRFNNIIRLAYDAIIINSENFLRLNPSFKPLLLLGKPLQSARNMVKSMTMFVKPPKNLIIRWATPRLAYYPNLEQKTRLRSLLVNWFAQLYIAGFLFITSTVDSKLMCFYLLIRLNLFFLH